MPRRGKPGLSRPELVVNGRLAGLLRGRGRWPIRPRYGSQGGRHLLPRLSPRGRLLAAGLAALLALMGGAWLWLRDSSLVAVKHVTVRGARGPDGAQIRLALTNAARNMTTLDVNINQLRTAVVPYPIVKDLRVSTQFPHGLRITVVEQIPVAAVVVDGRKLAVAGDGTLLRDVVPAASLAVIPLRVLPGGASVSDPAALSAVRLLSAAPRALLTRVSQVSTVAPHGLVAQIRGGPSIYFGDATRLAAKWLAASTVLAAPTSAGALYIDVTDPGRPAAGAGGGGSTGGSISAAAAGGTAVATSTAPATTATPAATTPGLVPAAAPAGGG